jgi:hypothetical protein
MQGLRAVQIKNDQEETIQQQTINSAAVKNVLHSSDHTNTRQKTDHPDTITLSHFA